MSDHPPPTPNLNNSCIYSTNAPIHSQNLNNSQNPPATPINLNSSDVVWVCANTNTTNPATPLQLISYPHPSSYISSPSPVILAYPGSQSLQQAIPPAPSVPNLTSTVSSTPAVMGPTSDKPKRKPRGSGTRTSKKNSKNSSSASASTTQASVQGISTAPSSVQDTSGAISSVEGLTAEPPVQNTSIEQSPVEDNSTSQNPVQDDSTTQKQISWVKDTNEDGKSMLDLIVEWLCFTWGDQDSPNDSEWMCMESYDTEATNYSRYRMGIPKKKECAERCGKFLSAKGFSGFAWAGVKQQIDILERKFHGADDWRTGTGGGVMMIENTEAEIVALRETDQWSPELEEEMRESTAKTTKDILLSKCSYYDVLLPIMSNRPSNEPMNAAETGMINSNASTQLSAGPVEETLSTQYSGWDQTQSIDISNDELRRVLEDDNLLNNNEVALREPSSSTPLQRTDSSPSVTRSKSNSRAAFSPANNLSKNDFSRRNLGGSGILKSFQSSLPTQADFKQMNENNKAANENQKLMMEQVAGATHGMASLIESRFGNSNLNNKRPIEEEDLTPEAIERRQAKKKKQDELEILKLDRELAQERRALEDHTQGSGLSKLELAREKISMIAKLLASTIPFNEAERMAQAALDDLK
ncbi:uncharacterized protein MELLADRAFT_86628 [Melampsora larici-populina 98AG31]|uniref:No apical meristem-associated C-terminal domain-containing protein n=1 Tax=Melampsora larici-populina (strain 98AG31 / pathotype 3-4-7) TaxID=747676 RepID=F4RMH1_MELLP|nr:uncharacterized protein MELLADRAFT_86628 [Melampsora larici-populina 98AG31]EGG06473.1 hypothetical protein MELLADRAFT_86628 [Melampsora larici-populina 98AG31]